MVTKLIMTALILVYLIMTWTLTKKQRVYDPIEDTAKRLARIYVNLGMLVNSIFLILGLIGWWL